MTSLRRTLLLLLLFVTALLLQQTNAKTLKLAVLMPFTGQRALGRLTAGAVTMAVDVLNTDPSLSMIREQGHNFTFTWRDTESELDKGLHEFVDLWTESYRCVLEASSEQVDPDSCQLDAFIGKTAVWI